MVQKYWNTDRIITVVTPELKGNIPISFTRVFTCIYEGNHLLISQASSYEKFGHNAIEKISYDTGSQRGMELY